MTDKINNAGDAFDFKSFVDDYAYLMLTPTNDNNRMTMIRLRRILVKNNDANHKHLNKKIHEVIERTLAAYYVGYISQDHYLFTSISDYAAIIDKVNKTMKDITDLKQERDSGGFYSVDAYNVRVMEKYINDKVEQADDRRHVVYSNILKDIKNNFEHYFNL